MVGTVIGCSTKINKKHMTGEILAWSLAPYTKHLTDELHSIDFSQLLHLPAANVSTVYGVNITEGKTEV